MKKNRLESTALLSPYQLRRGLPLAPKLVFLATLSLYVASTPVAADPAVDLPSAPVPGLDIEFRCAEGGEGPCPLDINDSIDFGNAAKYLTFEANDGAEGGCLYTPILTEGVEGIGSNCDDIDDRIGSDEVLRMIVFDADGGEGGEGGEGGVLSSTAMNGIYLNGLESNPGELCSTATAGTVHVELESGAPLAIDWFSDTSEGGGGGCAETGPHAIFVDFGGTQDVSAIEVEVAFGGVYAAGIELADVSPDTCSGDGDNNNDCEIELVDDPLPGGDLRVVIADPNLTGSISVSEGFPIRVRDDREACQWDSAEGGIPEPLVFDGSLFNVDGVDGVALSLVVSENSPGNEDFFTVSAKGCGVPRDSFDGPPVDRDEEDSAPYIDIIAMESDIFPQAGVLGFESDGLNATDYKCEPDIADRDLDQPFLEINARMDETKYLANVPPMGVPGVIDPVGRDIMIGCGSKRGSGRAFSFVAWNLIHALETDMHGEISAEIAVLEETVARSLICVDPAFASRQLRWPRYIRRYYDSAVDAADDGNPAAAESLIIRTVGLVERFKFNLEQPGVSDGFERCFAAGPNLDEIVDGDLLPGEIPLNAYGDIISQLEHLSYALSSFVDELKEPPLLP